MNIILLERVEKLGQIGDVVTVKPGYARNFLLPNGKALRANKANLEKFDAERTEIIARNADERTAAESKAEQMGSMTISLVRAASEMGQLFGSVTSRDIADGITEAGHAVEKRQVVMDKAIKSLGLFPITVQLHAEVKTTITINIARSAEEAETQLELGRAVISSENEMDETPEPVVEVEAEAEAVSEDDTSEPDGDGDAAEATDAEVEAEAAPEVDEDAKA